MENQEEKLEEKLMVISAPAPTIDLSLESSSTQL